MTSVSFTVPGIAAPAGSKRAFAHKSTGRIIVADANKNAKPWKGLVAAEAAQAMNGADLLDGPLLLELTFWVNRPKGHYGSGKNADKVKAGAPFAPTVKPDLLKLARAVEDALTGVVYRDDAQITSETLQKAYTTGSARTEVRVVTIAPPGEHRPEIARVAAGTQDGQT